MLPVLIVQHASIIINNETLAATVLQNVMMRSVIVVWIPSFAPFVLRHPTRSAYRAAGYSVDDVTVAAFDFPFNILVWCLSKK